MTTRPFGLLFWLDMERPTFPRLDHSRTADIAIVGAGIAGLKLARCLSRHGLDIVILEAGQVGDGASGRNQGSLNHAPGIGYAECIARPTARDLWRLGLLNHALMREQLLEYSMTASCDCVTQTLKAASGPPTVVLRLNADDRHRERLPESGAGS